jgi:hypothetical protein
MKNAQQKSKMQKIIKKRLFLSNTSVSIIFRDDGEILKNMFYV